MSPFVSPASRRHLQEGSRCGCNGPTLSTCLSFSGDTPRGRSTNLGVTAVDRMCASPVVIRGCPDPGGRVQGGDGALGRVRAHDVMKVGPPGWICVLMRGTPRPSPTRGLRVKRAPPCASEVAAFVFRVYRKSQACPARGATFEVGRALRVGSRKDPGQQHQRTGGCCPPALEATRPPSRHHQAGLPMAAAAKGPCAVA